MANGTRCGGALLAAGLTLALAGCPSAAPQWPVGASSRPIAGADQGAVFNATLAEMRARFAVDQADPDRGLIVARPQFAEGDRLGPGQPLRILSSRPDYRWLARAQVSSEEGLVRVAVSVALERRDTAALEAYHALRNPGDVPTATPIETGANLQADRREGWTFVRRAFDVEVEMLAGIERRLEPATQPAGR